MAFLAGENEPVPLVEAAAVLVVGRDMEIDVLAAAVPCQVPFEQQMPYSEAMEEGQHVQRADTMAAFVRDARMRVTDDPATGDGHEEVPARRPGSGRCLEAAPYPG